jgi:IS30 family transposase
MMVRRRYFELIRTGLSGSQAAQQVGVSLSCGSLWFIDAGSVSYVETPISPRYLSQDDRIEIADGLARDEPVKAIAARIHKSYQTVYREIARNRKSDGRYQPWYAHNQAHVRRRRPKPRRFAVDGALRGVVAGKLRRKWSPAQISRWLRRRHRRRAGWQVCAETIYEAVYRGLIVPADPASLRMSRTYRRRRGRGRSREGALKQSTNMKPIGQRPAAAESRRQAGHWEGDLIVGAGQRSAIATLVERKTRFTLLVKLPGDHSAQSVGDALIRAFASLPARLRRTLTWETRETKCSTTRESRTRQASGSTSPIRTHPGSGAPMKHQWPAPSVLSEGHRSIRLPPRLPGLRCRPAQSSPSQEIVLADASRRA